MGDNKAEIITRNGSSSVDFSGSDKKIPYFTSGTMDFDAFQKHVEEYLNSGLKDVFGDLLDSSMETRYMELSEKEQAE